MKKFLWLIPGLAFMVIGSPAARASATSYTPTFTCSSGCTSIPAPTAPGVTFPSPTLSINFNNITFSITLSSLDQPGDTYSWASGLGTANGEDYFTITDLSPTSLVTNSIYVSQTANYGASGSLTFASPVPEPSTLLLMLAGMVGLLLVSRKRLEKDIRPPA